MEMLHSPQTVMRRPGLGKHCPSKQLIDQLKGQSYGLSLPSWNMVQRETPLAQE